MAAAEVCSARDGGRAGSGRRLAKSPARLGLPGRARSRFAPGARSGGLVRAESAGAHAGDEKNSELKASVVKTRRLEHIDLRSPETRLTRARACAGDRTPPYGPE